MSGMKWNCNDAVMGMARAFLYFYTLVDIYILHCIEAFYPVQALSGI